MSKHARCIASGPTSSHIVTHRHTSSHIEKHIIMNTPKTNMENVFGASAELNERRDCAVKALALACDVEYKTMHAKMARLGRKHRKGTPIEICILAAKAYGFEMVKDDMATRDAIRNTPTIASYGRWAQRNAKTAVVLVRTRNHILCVRHGEVLDWTKQRRHRVCEIYYVVPINAPSSPLPTPAPITMPTPATLPIAGSNKMQVYTLWCINADITMEEIQTQLPHLHVKTATIKSWCSQWRNGKNAPTR